MLDFLMIATRTIKKDVVEIYPKFIVKKTTDLMIRGGKFYAIWDERRNLWNTDKYDATVIIDEELRKYYEKFKENNDCVIRVAYLWDSETGSIDKWHKYCEKQMSDIYRTLDIKLMFANDEVTKTDNASKVLPYPLVDGPVNAWSELLDVLYSTEERHKIEWCIGSIVSGDSVKLQKFAVLYGAAGTGKSTVLNIIQMLFEGYYSVFDAKALGSLSNAFALEPFTNNPLVAIQHDGDLSRIEDNTRLNSLVSHEYMSVNEKFKALYSTKFVSFLFMGTNKPVKITDAKSGLIRRLIDISPTGNKIASKKYKELMKQIEFELGPIAWHCREVYLDDPDYYDSYIPTSMLGASNDFYNFVMDSYFIFEKEEFVTLKTAWEMYNQFCIDAKVLYPYPQRQFKEELKNYFDEFKERHRLEDGTRVRNVYVGFKTNKFQSDIFDDDDKPKDIVIKDDTWISLKTGESILDEYCQDCPAQYANDAGSPIKTWASNEHTLKQLDTKKLHYVKLQPNHIVLDFDLKDKSGNKSLELNIQAAKTFPQTYCEVSKSGMGLHLHYLYDGDVSQLSSIFDVDIEIKKPVGNSAIRRQLSLCNDLPIATISSGLPMKGEKKVIDFKSTQSERGLRIMIHRNLNKEIHANTKPSIDFIFKLLEDAYASGIYYDVSDLETRVTKFAAESSNQADYCLKVVAKMKFKSDETPNSIAGDKEIVFFDIEVFPNLFLVNWKVQGEGKVITRWFNPSAAQLEELIRYRLIGFNCRDYDNHLLYARMLGYSNQQLFELSNKIILEKKSKFGQAYNISYTDVLDFSAKKQSLKKWEIELGIHHKELGLPWNEPVPEDKWELVAEYCDNDVLATEAVFNHLTSDWLARCILADISGLTRNDKTNSHTGRIIFGNNRNPKPEFKYRDLAKPVLKLDEPTTIFLNETFPEMMSKPHGKAGSLLPYFDGYKFENGKSTYKGEDVGEGGYVYAEDGAHILVALLDIASMHPHSAMAEVIFGPKFTKAFRDIVYARVDIKHESWEKVDQMFGGKLKPYIEQVKAGEIKSKDLAYALKIAINSVYGLTSARFDNIFRDQRNIDNIVAKRGALFMIDLMEEVKARGYQVVHIKTDSIKIANADRKIIDFCMDFGKRYGYTFEHEATYDRMFLANDAVYIAKYASSDTCKKLYGYVPGDNAKIEDKHEIPWTATGTQFAVPFVFKTLFSKEPVEEKDLCITNSVQTTIFLDMNEGLSDVTKEEKELAKLLKEPKLDEAKISELKKTIDDAHDYRFVGKVGCFVPIEPGQGGGLLMRQNNVGGYGAVAGSKGYRWCEYEDLGKRKIDMSYYRKLADNAVEDINKCVDFDVFANDPDYRRVDETIVPF